VRIIGLNGSPRRLSSRTGQLVEQVLAGAAAAGAETEMLDITRLHVEPCVACDRCHLVGACGQRDDFQRTFDAVMAAGGLVLGSPVYIYSVTAQLKNWIDRLGNTIHCQRFLGKYAAVVTTAGGSGQEETAAYMEDVLLRTGMQCIGRLARCLDTDGMLVHDAPAMAEARALGGELARAVREGRVYPEQARAHEQFREYFRQVITKRAEKWRWECDYWREQGWLGPSW
jgi:multimeric flavodoxin WrbA